jgi:hypothetical protein
MNAPAAAAPKQRKPDWIRVKAPVSEGYHATRRLMRELNLATVCEEAACPNIGECWTKKHATVMILGDTCTRACAFCNVKTGMPRPVDLLEPEHVATAAAELGDRLGDALRLAGVERAGHAGADVAEGAGPRARVAEDHHRRVLLGPALADVRAGRFLAHSREVEFAHQPARCVIAFADRRLDPDPVGLALLRDRDGSVHWLPDSDWRLALPPPGRVGSGASCPTSNI